MNNIYKSVALPLETSIYSELIYAYAKIDRLGEIEEFILTLNVANLQSVGDHLFDEALYEAAKIIFTFISNWAKLASTLAKLGQFQGAVDAARKANSSKTWKEVCFACVDAEEFRLAQICGLNMIIQVDDLEEVSDYYQNRGRFDELISLMKSIYPSLSVFVTNSSTGRNLHIYIFKMMIIQVDDLEEHWKELTYLYIQDDEFDNAATTIMNHSPEAWDHMQWKLVLNREIVSLQRNCWCWTSFQESCRG